MHAFQEQVTLIVNALTEAYTRISSINAAEMHWKKNKILNDINRHIVEMNLQLGIEPEFKEPAKNFSEPITKMFGKDVTPVLNAPRDVNKPFKQSAEDVFIAELTLRVDELWPRILSTQSDILLDSIPDDVIRAIAKRAGLPVTETSPDRITVDYIDKIKETISAKEVNQQQGVYHVVAEGYNSFLLTDNKEIFETYTDEQIRAIAKLAGLPFTANTPPKIDGRQINQIKAAIAKQKELNEKAGNV